MQRSLIRTIVLIVSLTGIPGLYWYSLSLEPCDATTDELSDLEGHQVRLSGYVIDANSVGDLRFLTLRDDHGSIEVMVESGSKTKGGIGDRVMVTGVVQTTEDGIGIRASGKESVIVLEEWSGTIVTIPMLASDPWTFVDRNVNLSCVIRIPITDSDSSAYGFAMDRDDPNMTIPIRVYGVDVQRSYTGAGVFINGRFSFSRSSLRFVLIIDEKDHHIWEEKNDSSMDGSGM